MMRTCKNCGTYFVLTVHGSTEYCRRVFDSRGRTCKKVGAMRQYLQSHAQEAFSAWSKEAQKEKEKCETEKISKDEFTQWLYRKYPLQKKYACPAFQTDDGVGYPPVCRISFFRRIL